MGNKLVFDSGVPEAPFTGGVSQEQQSPIIEILKLYNIRYFAEAFKKDQLRCDTVLIPQSGHTFLHEVIVRGGKDLFKLCEVYGADWNKRDILGVTPLMKASAAGNQFFVDQILKNGGDISLKDYDGYTAKDYAKRFYEYDVQQFLDNYEKKQ